MLDAPNIVGIHPVYFFPSVSHDFVVKADYLREFNRIDLLSRLTFTRNKKSERDRYRGLALELGARKSFYPVQNQFIRFGPYLQGSMTNEYSSFLDRKYYTGIVLITVGLRFQIKRFVLDIDYGTGPRFSKSYSGVHRTAQPNLIIGIAF